MTRSEIIDLSNQLSERKGERVLSLPTLFKFVCQDICKRQRFWWRRIAFSFVLTAGQSTYDLTAVTTSPANVMNERALDEITKLTLILSPSPYQVSELSPVFDPQTLIDMLNNTTPSSPAVDNNPIFPGAGGRYTMDTSGENIIRIDPPDKAYTAFLVGWSMPNPATDTTTGSVPVIPSWGHNTIVSGMVAKIFKFAYGSKNEKTLDAQQEYEQAIQDLEQRRQFDPNYRLQMNLSEDAVRST